MLLHVITIAVAILSPVLITRDVLGRGSKVISGKSVKENVNRIMDSIDRDTTPYYYDDDALFVSLQDVDCKSFDPKDVLRGVVYYKVRIPSPNLIYDCVLYTSSFLTKSCNSYPSAKCPLRLSTQTYSNPIFANYKQLCAPNTTDSAFAVAVSAPVCFRMEDLESDRSVSVGHNAMANFSPYVTDGFRVGFVSPYCLSIMDYTMRSIWSSVTPNPVSHGAGLRRCPSSIVWLANTDSVPVESQFVDVHSLNHESFPGDGIYYQDCVKNFALCFRILDLPGNIVRFHSCPTACGAFRPNTRSEGFLDWVIELLADIIPSVEHLAESVIKFWLHIISAILDLVYHTLLNTFLAPVVWLYKFIFETHIPECVLILLTLSRIMPWVMASFLSLIAWFIMVKLE